jgi:hypothetical protein
MGYELNVFTGQLDLVGSSAVDSINGITGAVTIAGGTGISVGTAGHTITIENTGVTSVGLADGSTIPIFAISGSPVTTTGTLTETLINQSQNTVFAGPTSGTTQPTFRALVAGDIPNLSTIYVTQSEVAQPNGVASLDSSGKIPSAQLPSTVLQYQGLWNPTTNTPTLQDSTGTNGYVYQVSAAYAGPIIGLNNPTMVNFQIGNLIIYSGSISQWEQTTPAAGVQSVNGAQGNVTVNAINQLTGDVTAGPATESQSQVASLVATSNSTLVTLSALSLPYSQLTGTPSLSGYATTTLNNLLSPTAVNQVLTFSASLVNGGLATPASTGSTNSQSIVVEPGNAVNGLGGSVGIYGGSTTGSGAGGTLTFNSGAASGTGMGGNWLGDAGSTTTAKSGDMILASGSAQNQPGGDITQGSLYLTSDNAVAIQANGSSTTATFIPTLQFWESTDSFYVGLKASNSITANTTWTLPLQDGTSGQFLQTNGLGQLIFASATGGGGTVTSVSVVSANGLAGTVATSTTTPAITLSTTVTGILQGNGTAISAATTTGSGSVVLSTSPTLVTPALGTPSALVGTNITGTASSLTAGNINATSNSTLTTLSALSLPTSQLTGDISLTTQVSGILPIANGGTNLSAAPTNGQLLIGNGTNYALSTLTAGTGISIANGSGTITVTNSSVGIGDITTTSFSAANNQSSAANVTGLAFSNSSVRAFTAYVSTTVVATSNLYEYFTLEGIQNSTGWYLAQTSVGDSSGFVFTITTAGQIQYTNSNYTGFTSATLKFRATGLPV